MLLDHMLKLIETIAGARRNRDGIDERKQLYVLLHKRQKQALVLNSIDFVQYENNFWGFRKRGNGLLVLFSDRLCRVS